jgi:hypothetical protein
VILSLTTAHSRISFTYAQKTSQYFITLHYHDLRDKHQQAFNEHLLHARLWAELGGELQGHLL